MKSEQINNAGRVRSVTPARYRQGISIVMFVVALSRTIVAVADPTLVEVIDFGTNPGELKMYKYVPPSLPASAPLVVALHGCTQRASEYGVDSGWIELAQRWKFALLLPEQQVRNNQGLCFNWFNGFSYSDWWIWAEWGSDQDRGEGEALSIKQMVERMKTDHGVDARRIFITGLSAGGSMTAVMIAAYPEDFAGAAILAGVPYKCARNGVEALTQCGVDLTHSGAGRISDLKPAEWGRRVRAANGYRGPWPRLSIWHGNADKSVTPLNARELLEQWTAVHDVDLVPDEENRVKGFPQLVYRDANGSARIEVFTIQGMGHGVAVDPGTGGDRCGRPGRHSFAVGICSSYYIGRFWALDRRN